MITYRPQSTNRGFQSLQHPKGQPAWWPIPKPIDPTNWCACGVWSLHHALVALGQATTDRHLKSLHGNLLDLTGLPLINDEIGGLLRKPLCKLVRKTGCRPEDAVFSTHRSLKQFLNHHLDSGHPVILGSDPAVHWICVIGRMGDGAYITADSADWPTVQLFDADSLIGWTGINDGESVDCVAVVPGAKMPKSRSFVPYAGGLWELLNRDTDYAANWTRLLDDMLEVFWDADLAPGGMPASEFFDMHSSQLVSALTDMSDFDSFSIQEWVDSYREVANFHSLVVAEGHLAESLSRLLLVLLARLKGQR